MKDFVELSEQESVANCYRRLVAAILKLAVRDAKKGDYDARLWLRSYHAANYAELLGIRQEFMRNLDSVLY